MNNRTIQLKGQNMELTPAIRQYVHDRVEALGKVLDLDDPTVRVLVEVGKTTEHHKTGEVFRAEFRVASGGRDYYAEAVETDLYAAIDKVRDELIRQIRRSKGRMRDLFERGARKVKKRLKGIKPWGKGQQ